MRIILCKLSLKDLLTTVIAPLLAYPSLYLVVLNWDSYKGSDEFVVLKDSNVEVD